MRNLSLAIFCLMVTACGIKGPLELPHQRYPEQHAQHAEAPRDVSQSEPQTSQSGISQDSLIQP